MSDIQPGSAPFYALAFVRKTGDKVELIEFVPYPPAVELKVLAATETYLQDKVEHWKGILEKPMPPAIYNHCRQILIDFETRVTRLQTELRPVLQEYVRQWESVKGGTTYELNEGDTQP
jgi:hypothetical protein